MQFQQNRTSQQTIILFTRYPRAGKVKTRLIDRLGPQGAATLHDQLTRQVINTIQPVLQARQVQLRVAYCGGSAEEMRSWLGSDILLQVQEGNDLGERMADAFVRAWQQGAERVVLIGSDCPGINPSIIESGFKYLETHDLVLGPAADGGYYLIGLRNSVQGQYRILFQDIDWGTGQVLQQTLNQAQKAGFSFALLPELYDIDRPEDLVHLNYYTDAE
ncbi:TIGR04282 family arsenosugar biosynthesis glycosyltransferase [Candidatus Electrothrix sp.]|uniref:TIGR04282 family arsenosugar biosynthesis glycosyltransferase n=1 Tax=Candidatus Electrothrix sp. TaxID=2170559 RepID=UPI00405776F4